MTLVMTTTEKTKSEKDFVARLADAGEEALQRLSELPGGQKAVTAYNDSDHASRAGRRFGSPLEERIPGSRMTSRSSRIQASSSPRSVSPPPSF